MRKIRQIYKADSKHWVGDGFYVSQMFSHMGEDKGTNPFLMLDYVAPYKFEPNYGNPRGVGTHPHKGFEIATIAYKGEVAHKDSGGGEGVIKDGDVQWINVGQGVVHEEFHSREFSNRGGEFEMVQLWINLPSRYKNSDPTYQHIISKEIPTINFGQSSVRVIAGNFNQIKGAANTFNDINVWDIRLSKDDEINLNLPSSHNALLVVLTGGLLVNGETNVGNRSLVGFENYGDSIKIKAQNSDTKVLLLSGAPINEPIVGYGPFVMNTKDEIVQAIDDFNSGKFGKI